MGKRLPTASEAIQFLATRHVAEQPDQKLEFGWSDIEAANDEYQRKGVSGMMLHADADTGKIVVQFGSLGDQLEEAAKIARDGEARGLRMERVGNGFVGVKAKDPQPEWTPENANIERLVANARLIAEDLPPGRGADASYILGVQVGLLLARQYSDAAVDILNIMDKWYNDAHERGETAFDVVPAMVKEIGEGIDIPESDPIWGGIK